MAQQHNELFTACKYLQIGFNAEREARNFKIVRLLPIIFLLSYRGLVNIPWFMYIGIPTLGIGTWMIPITLWAWLENFRIVIHSAILRNAQMKREERYVENGTNYS